MKNFLIVLSVFLISQTTFAQSYQIMNSASGQLETFTALTQDKELYGYIEVRKMDLEDKLTETDKYIVLDKNMNKVCSGDFTNDLIKKKCSTNLYDLTYCDGKIILSYIQYFNVANASLTLVCSYVVLDIATNKIISEGNFQKDIDLTQNPPKLAKQFQRYYTYPLITTGEFLIKKTEVVKSELETYYYAIDAKGEEVWQQETEDVEKKQKLDCNLIESDKDYSIFMATITRSGKKISDNLLILDAKTGKKVAFTELFNQEYTLKYLDISIKNGKLNMVGRYFEKDKRDRVDFDESLGLYRRIVDLKYSDVFLPFGKFNSLDIDENGRV